MKRGQRRTWIKLHITGMLHGSVRWQLSAEERATWVDLLCLAGECSKEGKICDNDGRPYPLDFVANQLNIPIVLLTGTIEKCKKEGRITDKSGLLSITNWKLYQSEYERQKPYREAKKETDPEKYIKGQFGRLVER